MTAEITAESKRNIIRFRRVLAGFDRKESDEEIKRAVKIWSEQTIGGMRVWANEARLIYPQLTGNSGAVDRAWYEHLEFLVSFASEFASSLAVPTWTSASGVEKTRWEGPYSGVLHRSPGIRAIDSKGGRKHYTNLLAHMPMAGLAPAIAGVRSSLQSYALVAHDLASHVSGLYTDRCAVGRVWEVPPGVILSTMYFGIDSNETGKPPRVIPDLKKSLDVKSVLRIGGWSAKFEDLEIAEFVKREFVGVIQDVAGSTEVRQLLAAKLKCEDAIEKVRELLSQKDAVRMTIAWTTCSGYETENQISGRQ